MRRLAVVILTWNGRDDTLACLDSLRGEVGDDDAVIVCDNGSADGTEDAIRSLHPWVEVIQNGGNLGFARGNNSGLRAALDRGFEWVLLLNNDTTVAPGALAALMAHATAREGVGAFQPLLVDAGDGRRIDSAGQLLLRRTGAEDALMGRPVAEAPSAPVPIFGASAAAALMRASALREGGLFDEDFFTILEDVDLMFRLRLAGFEVELVPQVRVAHKRGISGRASPPDSRSARRFWIDRNVVALALSILARAAAPARGPQAGRAHRAGAPPHLAGARGAVPPAVAAQLRRPPVQPARHAATRARRLVRVGPAPGARPYERS